MIPGTVDWEQSAAAILDAVRQAVADGAPLFTYLKGTRIELLEAELAASGDPSPASGTTPGTIEVLDADSSFQVRAGDGRRVRVPRYRIQVYLYESRDLATVLETFGLELPQRLGRVPFLENRDSTYWERAIRVWASGEAPVDWRAYEPVVGEPHPATTLIEPNRPYFRWLFDRLQVPSPGWSLDVGCADGWAMSLFAEQGHRVAGFDIAPSTLAAARRYVPGAHLAELDYYDAGAYYAQEGLAFDFVFSRGLGVAQKLLDWSEPAWVEATRQLADRLTPGGVLCWNQRSDRTGTITEEGFTNPPIATLLAHFQSVGLRPLSVGVFGTFYTLLLVRPRFPRGRARAFERANTRDWAAALAAFRAVVGSQRANGHVPLAERETIANAFRAACAHLSTLFLTPGGDDQHRLLIAGADPVAQLYARVAFLLRLPVVGYWSSTPGELLDDLITEPIGTLPQDPAQQPTAIVVADPQLAPAIAANSTATAGGALLNVWPAGQRPRRATPSPPIYLISGDQDQEVLPTLRKYMLGLADWPDEAALAPALLPSGSA